MRKDFWRSFFQQWRKRTTQPKQTTTKYRAKISVESLEDRIAPATFLVENTNDAGPGSFRQAIFDANANAAQVNEILFHLPSGVQNTIELKSALPLITAPVTIDASSESGSHEVAIDGSKAGMGANGLTITAGNSAVIGLVIENFSSGSGILLDGKSGNEIINNYIGTDFDGAIAASNQHGVFVFDSSNNIIGLPGEGNLISGNTETGITITGTSSGTMIYGNSIGVNATDTKSLPNGTGIYVDGTQSNRIGDIGKGNVISGNRGSGVEFVEATNNFLVGNYIGTNADSAANIGNLGAGVLVTQIKAGTNANNLISGNVISGNDKQGISISGGANNQVLGNLIGTTVNGAKKLPNVNQGILISRSNTNVIGSSASPNVISGNGGDGVYIVSGDGNVLAGNVIGLSKDGTAVVANGGSGVVVAGGKGNRVGIPGVGSFISGNGANGVTIQANADGTVVYGDLIGSKKNANGGIISKSAPNGMEAIVNKGKNSIISFNEASAGADGAILDQGGGADIESNDIVSSGFGIRIESDGNTVESNTITGCGGDGIDIATGTMNSIVQNTITDNGGNGVTIDDGATGNTLQANTIWSNTGAGIRDKNTPLSNTFTQNSIYENGALGIDDGPKGVTTDSIPVFTGMQVVGSDLVLTGTLNKPEANTTYVVEYFDNDKADPSGFGQGQRYLGSITVRTNGTGNTTFTIKIPRSEITGGYITATATDASGTSEFSAWIKAPTLPTLTVLVSDPNPSTLGQEVYFLVGVVSQTTGAGTPTGPVEFFDGSQEIGVSQLSIVNGIDEASFNTSTLGAGVHEITAEYLGDANFSPSTSAPLTQVVLVPTETTVVSNLNPEYQGIPIQFTATVAPTSGTGTPTGTVQFVDTTTGTTLGTGTLAVDPTTGLDQASITTSDFAVGDNTIEVTYGGDSQFAGSSTTYVQDILPVTATTTTLVSSVNPTVTGQPNTFTVTVTANDPSFGVPSGTVDLDVVFSNGNILTVGTATLNAAGQAQIPINFLLPPGNELFALYEGNYPFLVSESPLLNQVVNPADTTETLTAASSTVVAGQADNLSATLGIVPPGAAVVSPTGTATFWYSLDGGSATELAQLPIPGTGSIPAFTVPGTYQVWVTYSGDTNFNGSTSNTVTITVTSSGSSPSDPPWTLATNLPPAASLADPEVLAALLSHSSNTTT